MDRLRADVEALAQADGRSVGTRGHERSRRFLTSRLETIGLHPYGGESYSLEYRTEAEQFVNLLATAPGLDRTLAPNLVGAHYDTFNTFPGADDNAAAVAILLALAERLARSPTQRDVVFAFFDAEEPPCYLTDSMGSIRFYRDQRHSDFHVALILDLVGHHVALPGLEDLLFVTGMESSPCLEPVMRRAADTRELKIITALNRYVGDVSDHHAFRMGGTPYLFFSCGRWEHYHQPSDTPEKLNYSKISAQVGLLAGIVDHLADTPECRGEDYDTTATDLELMRRHLGELARSMGIRLESREEIDAFASYLISRLGI